MKHVIALAVLTLLMLMAFMASAYTEVDTVKDSVAAVSVDMDVGTVQQEGTCQEMPEWSQEMYLNSYESMAAASITECPVASNVHGAYEKFVNTFRYSVVLQTFSEEGKRSFDTHNEFATTYKRTWDVIAWTTQLRC